MPASGQTRILKSCIDLTASQAERSDAKKSKILGTIQKSQPPLAHRHKAAAITDLWIFCDEAFAVTLPLN
jgi:hypothetical protein